MIHMTNLFNGFVLIFDIAPKYIYFVWSKLVPTNIVFVFFELVPTQN